MNSLYPSPMPKTRFPAGAGSLLTLASWIAVIVAMGMMMGLLFTPGAWFASLYKPTWNPPAWLFTPVWTTLYVLMGIGIWLIRKQADVNPDIKRDATRLFLLQLLLNMAWTPLFFGLHKPFLAFVIISILWVAILLMLFEFGKIRPLAGYLLIPYLLWVSFALILNGTIWLMNT